MYSLLFFVDIHFLTGTAVRGARLREGEGRGGGGLIRTYVKCEHSPPRKCEI